MGTLSDSSEEEEEFDEDEKTHIKDEDDEYVPEEKALYRYGNNKFHKNPYKVNADNNSKHAFDVSTELLQNIANPGGLFELLPTRFSTWESLDDCLKLYEEKWFVKYVVKSSNSVEWKNNMLEYTGKPLFPVEFKYFRKTLICTHGWGNRSRANTNQLKHTRNTNCQSKINASLVNENNMFFILITSQETQHNHHVSQTLYQAYSDQRKILPKDTLGMVEKFMSTNTKRSEIWKYIRSTGK